MARVSKGWFKLGRWLISKVQWQIDGRWEAFKIHVQVPPQSETGGQYEMAHSLLTSVFVRDSSGH